MLNRGHSIIAIALAAPLSRRVTMGIATPPTTRKYPDLRGQWLGVSAGVQAGAASDRQIRGKGQQAPLTPEYQAIYEDNLRSQAEGGLDSTGRARCQGFGMPLIIRLRAAGVHRHARDHLHPAQLDRAFPPHLYRWTRVAQGIEPTLTGYSIGDGSTRTTTAATTCSKSRPAASTVRAITMPRACRCTRQPVGLQGAHLSRQGRQGTSCTTRSRSIDHALTRPWTVTRTSAQAEHAPWREFICAENNPLSPSPTKPTSGR